MSKVENTINNIKEIEQAFRDENQQKVKGKSVCGTFETMYWFLDK